MSIVLFLCCWWYFAGGALLWDLCWWGLVLVGTCAGGALLLGWDLC